MSERGEDSTEMSAESRRRMQNRLNQRASRRRKKELQQQQQLHQRNQFCKWVFYVDPRTGKRQQDGRHRPPPPPPDASSSSSAAAAAGQTAPSESTDSQEGSDSETAVVRRDAYYYNAGFPDVFLSKKYRDEAFRYFCSMDMPARNVFFSRLYSLVTRNVAQHTLDSQLLLSVMQFNVIRAVAVNASWIGVGMEDLAGDTISPFNNNTGCVLPAPPPPPPPAAAASFRDEAVHDISGGGKRRHESMMPPNLRPTALQRQVVHHPWIDMCPQPSLRDALLKRLHVIDEDEFCHHLFLQNGRADEDGMIGMVVWGEACDPAAYEISATMVRKWPWLVAECPDIIATTDYWRGTRDEAPLLETL